MLIFLMGILFSQLTFADVLEASPQLIDYEQNPSSLEWKKIDSEHFEVIFPAEVEKEAQRVTHLLEMAYPLVTRSLEVSPKKISLVLQNQSTVSNGFVTLAPRRSEWYLTPAIDPVLTNTEWLKTLSVHEFRHVVQFQKSRQGFNKVYEILLGEVGQALGLGLTAPPWLLEGDAVGTETALTKGGRGRLPLFDRDLKALLLSGKDFDYDKAHLGSFKDYIPNHYVYGYFYTSYMKNKHGDLFISKLMDVSADSSYNPLTVYNSYRWLTGIEFEKFYRETIADMIKNWKEKEATLSLTPYEVKNIVSEKNWTNYQFPQAVGEETYLALKSGLSDIHQFVLTDGKIERTLLYPGILQGQYPYKVRSGKFAWVEWEIDPRWGYRDFSRIRVFDIKSKKYVSDLRKTKGRLAVLDDSGEFILYVNWDENQGQHIVVTKLNGEEVYRLRYPKEKVITSLDWLSLNEIVMVVKDRDDLKQVVKLTLKDQSEVGLSAPSATNLGNITAYEGRPLVEAPLSGIDNIFEVKEGALRQITSSRFGAYSPSVYQNQLVFSDYTAHGMNIVTKKLGWDDEQSSSGSFVPVFEKFAASENQTGMDESIFSKEDYAVTPYSQVKNAVNLHSWFLLAPPLSSSVLVQGISRDILNKFALSAGASYDLNEKESQGFVSAAWSHLYPVFDLRAAYGGRNATLIYQGVETENDHWEEGTLEAGVQVPWKKIEGRFTHNFNLRGFGKVIKVTNKKTDDFTELRDGELFSPGAEVQYSFTSRLARRDLNPEWGVSLIGHIEEGRSIDGDNFNGAILTGDARLFLPGFMKHHSFFHQYGYEKQRDENYQYGSLLFKPRGTKNFFLNEAKKYSGNYMMPLFYPDWHLSRYLYLKRLSMNLFYDDLNAQVRGFNYHAASTGWELMWDLNLVRIFVPITLGVRGNYVLDGVELSNSYEIFVTTIGGYF